MIQKQHNQVTIVGSGLAGCFLAVLLAKRGYQVDIYEKLDKKDICDVASKRSYNIVLFGYGITLLKEAQLWNDIKPYLLSLKGTVTHLPNVKPIIDLVNQDKMPYFTVSRARLVEILLKNASLHSSVTIHYNTTLLSIDRHNKSVVIQNVKNKKISTIPCEVIIGADGANSLVRSFLQQGQHSVHTQEYAEWIYKQFVLSPKIVEKLNLEKKFVHIWTQKNAFITTHPASNEALGAMLVFPKSENFSALLRSPEGIQRFFTKNFYEITPALDEISTSIIENPDGNFATVRTNPWYYKDFITIIGDAAHGFYPFFGQGTTAAFTDCIQIVNLLDKYGSNWTKIFPFYQKARKKHADVLGELSKEVILKYLRYKKGDFEAIYDKLEFEMHRLFPKFVKPPLSQSIINDPSHAAIYRENYIKQRKKAKKAGISLLVTALVGLITLYEIISNKNK